MYKKHFILLLFIPIFLAGCDYSKPEKKTGFFYNTFAQPIDNLLHWLGNTLNNDYGLAIIIIVLAIRTIMLPFMLMQTKNGQLMRKTMEVAKPEVNEIQEKVKRARTQEEKMNANQEMMKIYNKYDINPMKSMLGCLPILIQMPVLFGLYTSLKWPTKGGLTNHPNFLWFDLTSPDIWITIIAGILYFLQSAVNLGNLPKEQRQIGYMMMIISPIFIIYISYTSASALGLYWSISAIYLIIQMYFSNKYYAKLAEKKKQKLMESMQGNEKRGRNTQVVSKKSK